ncbi:helix-turn-helix domain-containing protein [Paenibacillus segetis]|uniref:HTH cro/C1-type domain-containing protein n=1 Tax=Paenibacillus segetis TaxID=1325360 RepID=A0ABQ1YKL6_9BACL|nr:helix-turn-helix transcriptional regulator [Paenibacillus segetis]GGH29704.1 hypothetical protein GCM10008013_32450 [Paenibacillus segetis]
MQTIRAELEDYLRKNRITITQFAESSGVNSGTISSVIKGNRPISMLQLDRITEAMGLTEGFFYDIYVNECFDHSTINWRRIRPLLYRCAELDKLDCILRVLGMMMDDLSYAPALFDIAEALFKQDKREAAALLYKSVADGEKYQHSERLALCQYRLFIIALGKDQDANLRAAVQFEGYIDRLDEIDQLDALKDLANTYGSLHRWDKMEKFAVEMGQKATIQYKQRFEHMKKIRLLKEPMMPLFAYIAYSHVLCSAVYDERKEYDIALYHVSFYSDFSWIKEESQEAQRMVSKFKEWAKANTYLYRLLKGDVKVLPEYVAYISQRKDEILPALVKILQAANTYQINVDEILSRFEKEIFTFRAQHGNTGSYNSQVTEDRYIHFMAELADYYLNKGEYDRGIKCILESLEFSTLINSDECIIKCVSLFERFRNTATLEAQQTYLEIMRRRKEKKIKKN